MNYRKIVFLFLFFLIPKFVFAIEICPYFLGKKTLLEGVTTTDLSEGIPQLIGNLIEFVIECLVGLALVVVIILSGIYILTSLGNPEKINKGKAVLLAAIIGLIIIFGAEAVRDFFGKYIR